MRLDNAASFGAFTGTQAVGKRQRGTLFTAIHRRLASNGLQQDFKMTEKRRRRPGETRDKLMDAALTLVGKGRHFTSLGIREVTRQAGVVPTSFYRHFRNMDDLGLELVDQLGLVLRRMMREARQNVLQADRLMEESVAIFVAHVEANRPFFFFMAQGLAGESRAVQDGIRSEMRFFASELANDLRRMRLMEHLSDGDLELVCDLVVRSVAFSLTDLLGVAADDDFQIDQIRQRTTRFLQLVFVGAANWQSVPLRKAGGQDA